MEGSIPSAKFARKGDLVSGIITAEPTVQQQRDFTSGKPLMWEDGTPRKQLRIVLDTGENDPEIEGDDGLRAIYAKGQMLAAVRNAWRKNGNGASLVGGRLTVTYTGDGKKERGLNPPKLYSATFEPASLPDEGDDGSDVPGY
jgi:hypothetical protein